jgi:glycosyltransferase involved in cell wall biosynthesis
MSTPEVSVIIPAYNAARYLSDSITSVIGQSYAAWELVVVDDGSTDNTAEIAGTFLSDERIRIIKQSNKGVSAARNAGINVARGRYITFLDADDAYLPENIAKKYSILIQNPSIDFVYCDAIMCDGNLNEEHIEKGVATDNLFRKVIEWKGESIPASSSNIFVKARLMKEKFRFDEQLSNCADRYMKIMLAIYALAYYLPEALIKYRNSPGSMSKQVGLLEHDEKYIISKIVQENIVPQGRSRNKIIANIYLILSGSWYRNAHHPVRAIKYGIKAILTYPPVIRKLAAKLIQRGH